MMNLSKSLLPGMLMGTTVAGAAVLGLADPATAGTFVTCGPKGAARIVKVVPAGCRHLAATSAPKHSPDNTVKKTQLGFTFTASDQEAPTQPAVVVNGETTPEPVPAVGLW